MSKYNTPSIIGSSFYAAPPTCHNQRIEHIYNKVFSKIPITLNFTDELNKDCLEVIKQNFEPVCANISKVGVTLIDEGVWGGKENTIFDGVLLSVAYKTAEGRLIYDTAYLHIPIVSADPQRLSSEKLADELHVAVRAVCHNSEQAQALIDLLDKFKLEQKSKIYILTSEYGDLSFSALQMQPTSTDLELNYGDGFTETHNKLVNSLKNTTSGLYLFYGAPGTGKSSYIKHLLSEDIDRKMAYIPVSLIDRLTHPDMLPLLMNNKNIVLILEDAEKALTSREISQDSSIVSTILNLTDGFIGQAINISVVATFNTEKDKIDEALLRKGRLKMSHEFKKLSVKNCRKIAESIGVDPSKINEEMSLAEIYNFEEDTQYKAPEEKRVGFF